MVCALSSARPRPASRCNNSSSATSRLMAAGEAVQKEPVPAVGLGQPLQHHRDDDLVGDQLARVQVGLGHLAQWSAVGHIGPEDVAGGQVYQLEPGSDPVGLGALACPPADPTAQPACASPPSQPSQPAQVRAATSCSMLSGRWRPTASKAFEA
jgi:hypothetical protein